MFTNYIIKDNILFLEVDFNYEFGSNNENKKNIIYQIKEFISNNINAKFNKIVITCGGFIIGSIVFLSNKNIISENNIKYVPNLKTEIVYTPSNTVDNNENIIEDANINIIDNTNNNIVSNNIVNNNINTSYNNKPVENIIPEDTINKTIINIHRSNGQIIDIELEEYIVGVIAAEMPASFNIEALKAQSVLARTYALKAKQTGKVLTDTVSTQAYIDTNEMKNKWGSSFDTYYNKIKNAVNSTNGEYLSYNGNYIEALYHSTNNGKTESALDVFGNYYPYLISVTSEYDKYASSYLRNIEMDVNNFSNKLGIDLNTNSAIEILSYTDGNNIKEINIGGKTFSGKMVRELLGLRSADFDINITDNNITITTRGFGHGVGMSQYGANGMANNGYNYIDILYHYYPGTTLKK